MYKKTIKLLLHSVIWIGILIIITLMPIRPEESFSIQRNIPFIITYFYLIAFFYLNANILIVKLISNKRYLLYILGLGLALVVYIYLHKYFISLFIQLGYLSPPNEMIRELPPLPKIEEINSTRRIVVPLIQFLFFWVLSTSYRLVLEWVSTNRKNKEIETEKSIIELAYLKAQINPHFIFNTLNTIYSLTLNKSDKASEAILLYSDIVRYVLEKIDTSFVPLKEEVDYITNYINLQTLRFTDTLNINFTIRGNIENHKIAPLIFISFVENAFQYGISNHYHSSISFEIEASEDSIHFASKNKKYKKNEIQHIGKNIGIKNTKRKLNLIYPDGYKLLIKETNDTFCIDLTVHNTIDHEKISR